MKTYMFPGQGSQVRGMGAGLFDRFEELTAAADAILGYSVKELCLKDPKGQLKQTQFTQPALYVVNALAYFDKVAETGRRPDFVMGQSLGEFNALMAANCFDFEIGLELVRKRGEFMGRVSGGAMAAILNATREEVESILQGNGLADVDIANYNTPLQLVISGSRPDIVRAQQVFERGPILYCPLTTSGAFHSRYMRPAQEEFRAYLSTFRLSDPQIPVISNVTARPYGTGQIAGTLVAQIASTVRWSESIQYLLEVAAFAGEVMEFDEIGHGSVLTKQLHMIKQQASAALAAASGGTHNAQAVEPRESLPRALNETLPSRPSP